MDEERIIRVTRQEFEDIQELISINNANVGQEFFPSERVAKLAYKKFEDLER